MLEVRDLWFGHGHGPEVLRGVSISALRSEVTTILGPNGAGKSTLFKCILGIWHPQRGSIQLDGLDVRGLGPGRRARLFSVVPQEHEPPFPYKVIDVVLMGRASYLGLFSSPGRRDYRIAEEAVDLLGIRHLKDVPYTQISGGERQLVLIARALAQEAPVMVLDEPTSHLDFRNQVLVLGKIREVAREKQKVVLLTLHDPNLASLFSDWVVMLKKGRVICEGPPGEVLKEGTLEELYGIPVQVVSQNGRRIILPRFMDH